MLFVYLSINYLKLLVVHYQRAMGGRQRRAHRRAQETPKPTLKASVKVRDEFSSA